MGTPIWYSVDLRDGNQALVEPTMAEEKVEMFNLLVKLGFKETEVGFPATSQIGYDFLRILMERKLIPGDVKAQVLMQCREHLIKGTFETLGDVRKAIVYIYNSTLALQRDAVSHRDGEGTKDIAVIGTKMVQRYMTDCDTQIRLEYSSESLISTELDFTLNICTAVQETRDATKEKPIIINLPSTVEMTIPNVYVDQVEWMNTHFGDGESIIPNIHPHDDRGKGVASTELALLTGADRVEGILFDNGGRTGNVDISTVAYNMFSQGINPEPNTENIREIVEVYERRTKMDIPPGHPYADKLVLTAFPGSHQDVVNKGMQALHEKNGQYQEASYLPTDPDGIDREYRPIVRINSQFDKGGVAFIMDTSYGPKLPKGMHKEFADAIQKIFEQQGEVAPEQVMDEFKRSCPERREPMHSGRCRITGTKAGNGGFTTLVKVTYPNHGIERTFEGVGDGPIDAVRRGMEDAPGIQIKILSYSERVLTFGSGAGAASCIHLVGQVTGRATYSVGISSNITRASIRGILSVVNRPLY